MELFDFASPGEAVAWLREVLKQLARDEPDANVALVARFPQQAELYFEGLERAEVPNVRRVAKQDFSWDPGVDVTDVRQTKGLEFDEVVLLETTAASYPATPPGAARALRGRDAGVPPALVRGERRAVEARHERHRVERGSDRAWACFRAGPEVPPEAT